MDTPQQGGGGRDLLGPKVFGKFRKSAMSVIYRVSSSVRVRQLEAELSHQLSALRTQTEDGFPQRAASSRCYRCERSLCPVSDTSSITPAVRWAHM